MSAVKAATLSPEGLTHTRSGVVYTMYGHADGGATS